MRAEGSFPRQYARTRRFTLGVPRDFEIAPDGSRVAFLRALAGDDPTTALWVLDLDPARERLVCDPRDLSAPAGELPPEERARRERAREAAGGVVAYAVDRAVRAAAFALGGGLFTADLETGEVSSPGSAGPVVDPRPDPTGRLVAYVTGGSLHVLDLEGEDRELAGTEDPEVTWGLAEFIASEEMGRHRGYWWAPDGSALLAARVDNTSVRQWTIADPSNPEAQPTAVRYPAAGTANADVSLWMLPLDGKRVEVDWDREAFPYLARALWKPNAPPTALVQSRDQRTTRALTIDPRSGRTELVREEHDEIWVDLVDGVPDWLFDGRLVATRDDHETRRLEFGGEPVTPAGLQVRAVLHAGANTVIAASEEPTEHHVLRIDPDGGLIPITTDPGVHVGIASDDLAVITSMSLNRVGTETRVLRGAEPIATIPSVAERPTIDVRPRIRSLGSRQLRTVVLVPEGTQAVARLPVLLDPYGGPHFQRVLAAQGPFLLSQWFADQGFAVVISDGRGTPGRGPSWDRAVSRRLGETALEDQVEALHAAAAEDPRLDLSRVAIRGWSFGGYLAAMAVLRRPDVFHAAVAGAPVTDQRLYDTHYTERYLGHPDDDPETYRSNSLLDDAPKLERPLLLIHGLADDNVVVAHTLRLSQALTEAGRPHTVLPLSGITHMTPQEAVAQNLIRLELAFLRRALGIDSAG